MFKKNNAAGIDSLEEELKRLVNRISYGVNEYEPPLLKLLAEIRQQMQGDTDSQTVHELQQQLGRLLGELHIASERSLVELPLPLFQQLLAAPRIPGAERRGLLEQAEQVVREKGSLNAGPWLDLVAQLQGSIERHNDSAPSGDEPALYQQAEQSLLQLLQSLELPEVEATKLVAIKQRLKTMHTMQQLVACIEEIYALVASHRQHGRKNHHSIEDFLLEMKTNLQEMQGLLRGLMDNQQDSFLFSSRFSQTLESNIKAMNQQLESNADIQTLKQDIKQSMHSLNSTLERFSQDVKSRQVSVQNEMQQVNARMNALEIVSEVLKERLQSERKLAMQDPLTGMHNRLAYDERISDELERFQRYQSPFVLLVWDLDHFKGINDEYGHLAGDKVLQSLAEILMSCTRRVDFSARYGGEEFVVIMPNTQMAGALQVAEKIRAQVARKRFHYNNRDVDVTISCGLAEVADGDSVASLFKRADEALYHAKREGRNRCVQG